MSPSIRHNPINCLNPISDADAAHLASPRVLADLAEAILATPVPADRVDHPRRSLIGVALQPPSRIGPRRVSVRSRRRRWLVPLPLLAAGAATLAIVLTAGESGSSLVSRAYAAISSTGVVVHYVESTAVSVQVGRSAVRGGPTSVSDVWVSGARTHVLTTMISDPLTRGPHSRTRTETVIDGHRFSSYASGNLVYGPSPHCGKAVLRILTPFTGCGGNPVAILRATYRSGALHAAGHTMLRGHRVDVITGRVQQGPDPGVHQVRVLLNPGTFVPLEITISSSGQLHGGPQNGQRWHGTTTTMLAHYERLPLNSHNLKLLRMRAHPHAHIEIAESTHTS